MPISCLSLLYTKPNTMAISTNNIIIEGLSGLLGQQLCFKNYRRRGTTVVSKKPNMDNVVPSEKQLQEKSRFGDAIRFAQSILRDPAKKAAYKTEEGRSVYHTAITDYLAGKI